MNWLLWKEYRNNRVIVFGAATFLILPYVTISMFACFGLGPTVGGKPDFSAIAAISAVLGIMVSQLTLGMLGGHLIAGERADRSAEFLAYLPVSRARLLAGKIALSLLHVALIWGPNLLILQFATAGSPHAHIDEGIWRMFGYITITGLTFFCVGWLFSSILESPTFAILGGLMTPVLVVLGVWLAGFISYPLPETAWLREQWLEENMGLWYRGICLPLSPVCFVAGTWYYLRRVEP